MAKLLKLVKDHWLFWAVAFLLFFIPLYPKFPLFGVSGTYVSIRLEDLFIAVIVGLFAFQLILKRDFSLFKEPLTKLILLFFGIGFLSILSAFFITKNLVFHLALLHFLRRVEYLSLLYVSYFSFKNPKQLKTYGWVLLVSTFGVIFYGLGQKFFSWPVVSTMNKEFSKGMILKLTWWARVNSTFAGHYDLAAFMVMVLPLIAAAVILAKKVLTKVVVLILGIASYYILILTASRISFAAYLIAVSFVLWESKKKLFLIPFFALSFLGMIFSSDLGQRYAATFKIDLSFLSANIKLPKKALIAKVTPTPEFLPTPVVSLTPVPLKKRPTPEPTLTPTPTPAPVAYIEPTVLATGRSTDIRLKVEWPRAVRAFLKNPLLGTGYSSITLATDNDYLRMLGETGLLGSLAFLAVILEICRRLYFFLKSNRPGKEEKLVVLAIAGSGFGYFLNATFIDVWEASKVAFFFWILMGIALKIIDLGKANGKNS